MKVRGRAGRGDRRDYTEVGGSGALLTARAADGRILLAGDGEEFSTRILEVDADGNPLWGAAFPDPTSRVLPGAATFTSDGGAVVIRFGQ